MPQNVAPPFRNADPPIAVRIERCSPPLEGYLRLRELVGWAGPSRQAIQRGLQHALFSVSVFSEDNLVGCGRVIGDGGLYFYVQDIIVDPTFQGQGLGGAIMSEVMAFLAEQAVPGAFVGLMAAVGVDGFYRRYGFARRPDERPGMFLVWPPKVDTD